MVDAKHIMLAGEMIKAKLREGSPNGRLAFCDFCDDEGKGYTGSNEKRKLDCKPDGIILEDDGY